MFVAADFTAAYPAASMSITWRLVQSWLVLLLMLERAVNGALGLLGAGKHA